MINNIGYALITVFGVGKLPKMPGTFGSIAAMPLLWIMSHEKPSIIICGIIFILINIVSTIAIRNYQKLSGTHDSSIIVIDEVIGMYTGWLICRPSNFTEIILLFILFRFFDITKIWPASYFDKKNGSFSVIADDIVAGVFTGLILIIMKNYANFN